MSVNESIAAAKAALVSGEWDAATNYFLDALRQHPPLYQALKQLFDRGQSTQDRAIFEQILACAPVPTGRTECNDLYAKIARTLGRLDEAEAFRSRAEADLRDLVAADAGDWKCRRALGNLQRDFATTRPPLEESLALFNDAHDVATVAHRTGILNDRAMTRRCLGDRKQAEEEFSQVLKIDYNHREAHTNRALLLLLRGEYDQGLSDYEWRRKEDREQGCNPSDWQGKRVVLWWEQGAGDQVQMVRFVRAVREVASNVLLVCERGLVDLFADNNVADQIIPRQKDMRQQDFPGHNVFLPVMSLPFALRLQYSQLPWATSPYLQSRPDRLPAAIAEILAKVPAGTLRIGLAWAGNPFLPNDHLRSCQLASFEPLLRIPGTSWFSLQVGLRNGDAELIKAWSLPDLSPHLQSYAITAAVIDQLNFVIAVDTSVAHVAGALGKDVAVALPFDPDWRWWKEGPKTNWYAKTTIFRQTRIGGWGPVITGLEQWIRSRLPASTQRR